MSRSPGLDTPLARSALPVLQRLRDNLEGQPMSVTLADARGVLLSRLTADHDLERQQAQDSRITGHVTGDDLPQDPPVRNRHPGQLTSPQNGLPHSAHRPFRGVRRGLLGNGARW
jgi:hypothetical protein